MKERCSMLEIKILDTGCWMLDKAIVAVISAEVMEHGPNPP
jgi:hypothetical protein